ncbi:hypothetical protein A2303_00355 [Candidatus Falkowbacteria bacterium RIFOXYB2_FULL_47_14]|uniref:HTH HARE-type domain-containing protein n=1 Tax=Candidatus Falkowbacteria bacterium RIFOXYA2_FULL_47_19 TaxID=1797994 RepID=A0A1F5SP12_9BACT|nr:MAG: hypothetical protein A2227_05370 [Candidatus Falkowbacteria bacterium RIFOXYA2_FULL_47_19]OGF43010.1 MAG: hypothetical protein A2303_00355 [Candidatus Falkowbacteria bacterium RIFOXYB2_FULL_47_14]
MNKQAEGLVNQIKGLIDELAQMTDSSSKKVNSKGASTVEKTKGAIGGLNILLKEGFFDTPQDLSSVLKKLQEIGRYYPRPSVAMNLLNLTKKRILTRIKNKTTKGWQYVIHK